MDMEAVPWHEYKTLKDFEESEDPCHGEPTNDPSLDFSLQDDDKLFLIIPSGYVSLEPEEEVLSDVHVFCSPDSLHHTVISRFVFKDHGEFPAVENVTVTPERICDMDTEDDLQLQRAEDSRDVLLIEHRLATVLTEVGMQVWRGSLYLCDFILANRKLFQGRIVVELGAGVGLTSLILAHVGSGWIFCTDGLKDALELCRNNMVRNKTPDRRKNIFIKELDWRRKEFPQNEEDEFCWTRNDFQLLAPGPFIIVAADVIYSDALTDAFFDTLLHFRDKFHHPLEVWLSIEKRLNFTIEELQVCSPPYQHFRNRLEQLSDAHGASFRYQKVSDVFSQSFEYERVCELELWKISLFKQMSID